MGQPPSLILELIQHRSPRRSNRFDVRIHKYSDKGLVIHGWCVYDREGFLDERIIFRSHILAAVEDECARRNRADL